MTKRGLRFCLALFATSLGNCTTPPPSEEGTDDTSSDDDDDRDSDDDDDSDSDDDDDGDDDDDATSTTSSSSGSSESSTSTTADPSTSTQGASTVETTTSTTTDTGSADETDDTGDTEDPVDGVCPDPSTLASSPFENIEGRQATRIEPQGPLPLEITDPGLAEGPVWVGDSLLFTHFSFQPGSPAEVLRFTPPNLFEVAVSPNAGVNGLAMAGDGTIIGASHLVGGLVEVDVAGNTTSTLIAEYNGSRLNSPNDLAIRADGNIYFSEPQYQAPEGLPGGNVKRFFRYAPDGTLSVIEEWRPEDAASGPNDPNGVSLSPDGNTLYLGHGGGVNVYMVNADGSVMLPGTSLPNVFHPVDGMAIDCAGNVYATDHGSGRVTVVTPDGTAIDTITVAGSLTNLAFGGPQRTTLFATAGDPVAGSPLYSIELAIPGLPY